jgi:hypothetical protein
MLELVDMAPSTGFEARIVCHVLQFLPLSGRFVTLRRRKRVSLSRVVPRHRLHRDEQVWGREPSSAAECARSHEAAANLELTASTVIDNHRLLAECSFSVEQENPRFSPRASSSYGTSKGHGACNRFHLQPIADCR